MKLKKKYAEKIFFFSVMIMPFVMSNICNAGTRKTADGSFIQAGLCGTWTDERWQQEFAIMKEAGMHYLVIGPVAEKFKGKLTQTLYPSSLENTEMAKSLNGHDMVDVCLKNAESAGIKVFIGIGMNDRWWDTLSFNYSWLYDQMYFDNKVCDEVWDLYKAKYPSAFYGWYWVYEVANVKLTPEYQDGLASVMNMQLDHLTATNKKLPFMWCPFMNSKLGTPEEYQALWGNVFSMLHTTDGDIFAPQDCVGAGGLALSEIDSWFSALRKAVDTKPGLLMWSDVETFDHHNWRSATIDRYILQMEIERPYVENFITFAYCHYYSPYNVNPGYHLTYMDYLKKGTLEKIPPSVPANLTVKVISGNTAELNWDSSSDNIGVCGYNIYRDGNLIGNKQLGGSGDNDEITISVTSWGDKNLIPGNSYTYQVRAYDFANNLSDMVEQIIVTTK